MQKAIEILIKAREDLGEQPASPLGLDTLHTLDLAISHLKVAQLIDQEPLNTLLVNALRVGGETQRLLIKNILERNSELMLLKDPKVHGLPKLDKIPGGHAYRRWSKELLLFLHPQQPMPSNRDLFAIGYFEETPHLSSWVLKDYPIPFVETEGIRFYMDPMDVIKLMVGHDSTKSMNLHSPTVFPT